MRTVRSLHVQYVMYNDASSCIIIANSAKSRSYFEYEWFGQCLYLRPKYKRTVDYIILSVSVHFLVQCKYAKPQHSL